MRLDEWRRFYASLGFATIPVRPREKRPLRKGWLLGHPEQWVGAPGDANIGVLTGAPSGGLVVLDFDTRDGPERVLGLTPAQLAVVTMVVETARGWHVYARRDGVATSTPREGLDVRGEGGMVLAPPSLHPSGHRYAFVGACRSLLALDAFAGALGPSQALEVEEDLARAEAWVELQAPKLREAWARLRAPPSTSWDPSRADFAVARCLWEAGWTPKEVAGLLLRLPGSRAHERGEAYALRTAERAAAITGSRR